MILSLAHYYIAVDIGNSRIKYGLFHGDDLRPKSTFVASPGSMCGYRHWLRQSICDETNSQLPDSISWIVADVHSDHARNVCDMIFRDRSNDTIRILKITDIPMKIGYDYPEQLGIDRALAAFAAQAMFSASEPIPVVNTGTTHSTLNSQLSTFHSPIIVVDIGTAMTVDWVDAAGTFVGGMILPGPTTAAQSLHKQTASLPMISSAEQTTVAYPATNTADSISLGIEQSLVGAIITAAMNQLVLESDAIDPTGLPIVITGGGASRVVPPLLDFIHRATPICESLNKLKIIVDNDLVLCGIARQHNHEMHKTGTNASQTNR